MIVKQKDKNTKDKDDEELNNRKCQILAILAVSTNSVTLTINSKKLILYQNIKIGIYLTEEHK